MESSSRLNMNIRSLREAFGETGAQLAKIIHVAKNTISSYESGRTEPSHDTLIALAAHFVISVDELLLGDYSNIPRLSINSHVFKENIKSFLPIITSDMAMKNTDFNQAFKTHEDIYNKLSINSTSTDSELLDSIFSCVEKYCLVGENNDELEIEALSNILALYFLYALILNGAMLIFRQPALIGMLVSTDKELNQLIQSIKKDMTIEKDLSSLIEDFHEGYNEIIISILSQMKNSATYSDLADYYLALQYIWKIKDNNYEWGTNQQIGIEMMDCFASVGNTYAHQYLTLMLKVVSLDSSQNVDKQI